MPGTDIRPSVYQALVTGDRNEFQKLFHQDNVTVTSALNSMVTYSKEEASDPLMFELPLALAACSGNSDLLKTVMKLVINMRQEDSSGNNILHCLVLLADEHPAVACDMYNVLIEHADVDIKKKLLGAKNQQQHTPLSLAAHTCIPEIIHCILNTDGVYRFEMGISGPYRKIMYKFHDDAVPTKLLDQLVKVSNYKLQRFTDTRLFHMSPVAEMRKKLSHDTFVMFCIWAVYCITIVCSYFVYVRSYLYFGTIPKQAVSGLLGVIIAINVFSTVYITSKDWKSSVVYWRHLFSKDRPAFPNSLVITYGSFNVFVLTIAVTDFIHTSCDDYIRVRIMLHTLASLFGIGSLLYLLQAYFKTAYLLAVMQKMVIETVLFLIVGFMFYATFAVVFYILETPFECRDYIPANNSSYNPQNLSGTLYRTLLLVLNVKSPDDVYFTESNIPTLSMFFYVSAVLTWPLMLLNLLIGK